MVRRSRLNDIPRGSCHTLICAFFGVLAIMLSGSAGPGAVAWARSHLHLSEPAGLAAGGAAAEPQTFRIDTLDGSPVTIEDFDLGAGDQVDLSAFLARFGPRSRQQDFVEMRFVQQGTILAVDPSGSGQAFIDAALVEGVDLTRRRRATPDPIPEPVRSGRLAVELLDVVQVPGSDLTSAFAPLQYLYHASDGSDRLFVCDLRGQIWVIEDGVLLPEPFLDVAAVLDAALNGDSNSGGLRSFAFHPDFDTVGAPGFRKLYTVTIEVIDEPATATDGKLFPLTRGRVATLDVLSEWSVDPSDPRQIDPRSRRVILRVEQPRIGHSTEHIGFNPGSRPGDAEHGLLYIAIGDGGFSRTNPDRWRNGQDPGTVLGTILRIDPLPDESASYTVPADNPFVDTPGFLPEVWAYGLRNPQRFSWDTGGDGKMLIGDIGQAHVEEVNLGVVGANYGWRAREGTFVLGRFGERRLFQLPPFDISFRYTYPVAQYDHDEGAAIAGGYVYRGSRVPQLIGKYVFGDLVNGRVFYVDAADLELGR